MIDNPPTTFFEAILRGSHGPSKLGDGSIELGNFCVDWEMG